MSENTFIHGWNIRQGDYVGGSDYDKPYPDIVVNKKRRTKLMFLFYNTIGISGVILVLSFISKI
ncbi:MAG: hypothetical protein K8H86_02915 [Ignavibacteriaceae bacterium]|nr:hypothetical protein [Ignavibacteriaceae bacterium]